GLTRFRRGTLLRVGIIKLSTKDSLGMWGALKELLLIIAAIAALVALARYSDPTENFLHTGQTCREIREHLAAKQYRDLTPAEETDMANCN
ncbi:MAG: hypothetical protein WBD90_02870, partial [Xanthobacteraceae bacterium]